jgi:hypothetical protein
MKITQKITIFGLLNPLINRHGLLKRAQMAKNAQSGHPAFKYSSILIYFFSEQGMYTQQDKFD